MEQNGAARSIHYFYDFLELPEEVVVKWVNHYKGITGVKDKEWKESMSEKSEQIKHKLRSDRGSSYSRSSAGDLDIEDSKHGSVSYRNRKQGTLMTKKSLERRLNDDSVANITSGTKKKKKKRLRRKKSPH